jgi:hypothetical protein
VVGFAHHTPQKCVSPEPLALTSADNPLEYVIIAAVECRYRFARS